MNTTRLDIYAYTDHRRLLADRLEELRIESAKFSRRYFCRKVGLASTSYLKRIIDGSREISDDLAQRITTALGFKREEKVFFYDLVRYGQAKTTTARMEALEILRRNKRFRASHRLALDHLDYLADPLQLTLRELVALKDFREDPAWIALRLPGRTTEADLKESLARLERIGLLQRDERGRLIQGEKHQTSGDVLGSVPLRTYHRNMLRLAAEAIELPVAVRHLRGLTMAVSAACYTRVVEEIALCLDKVRGIVDAEERPDQVYHLELAFFPLTRTAARGRVKTDGNGSQK